MPHTVLESAWLAPAVRRLVVQAPRVVRRCGPGQFVIVRATADGERIPLTIAASDRARGTVTLIIQSVGLTTRRLCALEPGDAIADLAGPLGRATELPPAAHTVLVGGGVGTAVIFPQAQALRAAARYATAIVGGRSKPYVLLEQDLAPLCNAVLPCTDDGSHGFHGFVTQRLAALIADSANTPRPVQLVFCAGPVPMMRAVAELTRPLAIHTVASLNPLMVDGTGMCGGCRVTVNNQAMFACVDGPEFDAHQVDFASLADRLTAYKEQERRAAERHQHDHPCNLLKQADALTPASSLNPEP